MKRKARKWKRWAIYFAGEWDYFTNLPEAKLFAGRYDVMDRIIRIEVREILLKRRRK